MFYLSTHSTHFIYGYMASDISLRTILIVRKETRCHHSGYSYRLTARVLLYAPSHRQDNTYHGLCYTSRGSLDGTRNSSIARRIDLTTLGWASKKAIYICFGEVNFGQCVYLNYQAVYYFNHKCHIILHTINITKLHDTDLNYRVRYNSVVACLLLVQ